MLNSLDKHSVKIEPGPGLEIEYKLSSIMVINANTRYLAIIGDFVRSNAKIAGFGEMEACSIELALDEMVSNSIIHGYTGSLKGEIKVQIFLITNGIKIVFEERGREFNPFTTEEPDLDAPLSERKIDGLGLFIVKQIMDEIYFESPDDKLKRFTLIKWVDKSFSVSENDKFSEI